MRKALFAGVIMVLILTMPSFVLAGGRWFDGGTLHRSNVSQWNRSTYANKLATAADMALAANKVKAKVQRSGSMETLKPFAKELVECVNEATAGEGYERTGVAELAAGCMILMGWQ